MLDISPLFWFSKKQSAIKTCSFGSEFIWYLVEVVGHDRKKVLWEVVGDHVVEQPTDHDEIGLRGFDSNCFEEDKKGQVEKGPVSLHIY